MYNMHHAAMHDAPCNMHQPWQGEGMAGVYRMVAEMQDAIKTETRKASSVSHKKAVTTLQVPERMRVLVCMGASVCICVCAHARVCACACACARARVFVCSL